MGRTHAGTSTTPPSPVEERHVPEKNVFVIGLDEANLPTLNAVPDA